MTLDAQVQAALDAGRKATKRPWEAPEPGETYEIHHHADAAFVVSSCNTFEALAARDRARGEALAGLLAAVDEYRSKMHTGRGGDIAVILAAADAARAGLEGK